MNRYLPISIQNIIKNENYNIDQVGKTNSNVYIFEKMVLKIQETNMEIRNEIDITKRLSKQIKVPSVIKYIEENRVFYYLMSRVKGKMLCNENLLRNPELLIKLLSKALKSLWAINIEEYNIDTVSNIKQRLKIARYNVENNLVDTNNVMPETFGENGFKTPKNLLEWLESNIPTEDLVFTHGDFCFKNIFYENNNISGFVDLGKAGVADRWQDLAICIRELNDVFSNRYVKDYDYRNYSSEMLLSELGIKKNNEKLKYYLLLDELF